MNFRPELAEKVLAGEKTVTRRIGSNNPRSPWWIGACTLTPGKDYAVCPGRGQHALGRVTVESVTGELLGELSDDEARAEGFEDAAAFTVAWCAIHGGYDRDVFVWRVELRDAERRVAGGGAMFAHGDDTERVDADSVSRSSEVTGELSR